LSHLWAASHVSALIWADSGYKKGGFVAWVKATLGWEVEIVEHAWSGVRSVWVPEGVEVEWEKIRPSGCAGAQVEVDSGAHVRLAFHVASTLQRL
jgi:hypothetical protein